MNKQISLTLPVNLLDASKEHYKELGYRTIQEFIIDLIRRSVLVENLERYSAIEQRMKKGLGVKKFSQKDAAKYLRNL